MVEECNFSFANIESSDYGIFLANIGSLSDTLFSGANTEIISTNVTGRSSKIVYGVKETEVVSFPITLIFPEHFSFETMCDIKHWLFGQSKPQKLKFHHPDLEDYYFSCFLRCEDDYHDGRNYRAMKITVESVSPYAFNDDVSFVVSGSSNTDVYIQTEELTGVKPIVEFTITENNQVVELANHYTEPALKVKSSDKYSLRIGDVVKIDNRTKFVRINNKLSVSNMSFENGYGFITLVDGVNTLQGTDGVEIKITYTPTRRIGGV